MIDRAIFSLGILLALLVIEPATSLCAGRPAEQHPGLTDDGGWCWFSDPRAVVRGGKTYTGWVTQDGSIQAAELDHATDKVAVATLHEKYERDDHDNPAFAFAPGGRLLAFYSRHNGKPHPAIHMRAKRADAAFSEWEPEVALPLVDDSRGKAGMSYCNPFFLSGEHDALYLFWRGLSYKPTMAVSPDGGKTWSKAKILFSPQPPGPGQRPYAKYASNGKDRIHFLFTDGHPRNEPTNSVYYACYRSGAFYRADGTRICGVAELPIRPEQADKVYDGAKGGARAWIWGIAFDGGNRPVIVYSRLPSETDHRYHYVRWDGARWADTELCAAGRWFPQTPSGVTEKEPHYSSGLALDPADPSVVYLTRPVKGVRELEKWTTSDGGATWKTEAITSGSKHDNVRPYVPIGHTPESPAVLWMNLSGGYRHYTDYRCSIKWSGLAGKQDPKPE